MTRLLLAAGVVLATLAAAGAAEPAAPLGALAKMPVKEVTVFKDGHAYVVHQGTLPVDAAGNVTLDLLPNPVLGTFWPYSTNAGTPIQSVTAGRRRVTIEQTALTVRELLDANPGAEVIVTEGTKPAYRATIVKTLERSTDEVEKTTSAAGTEPLPQKGNVLLLKTEDGTKAVNPDAITDVKFVGPFETKRAHEEYRNVLTLKLDGAGKPAAKEAEVGMAYVQKGLRWIPNYRVELDGKGKAVVKMQATLINELTDLKDATVNLVVGVPSFYFKETADPIAMSQALAQLSPYFQTDSAATQYALSNSIMTQQAGRATEVRGRPPAGGGAGPDLGPEVGGTQSEDLFVFTVKNVTLAKGQRMTLAVSQQAVGYKDVYTLDVPFAPPPDLRRQVHTAAAAELAKLMAAPKVQHKVRLTNGDAQPFTTAPALILKEGKVLAQGLMTYASKRGTVDLAVTAAVDVKVKKKDKEVKRTPNAQTFEGHPYWRIDVASSIELTNGGPKAVEVEVTRSVLGNLDKAGDGVTAEMVNLLEDDDGPAAYPAWWGYYSWPAWWSHYNGIGRVTWTTKLEPGQTGEQAYTWHYYWR